MAKGKAEKAGKEHETRKGDRKHQDKKKGKQKARGAYRSEKAGQTAWDADEPGSHDGPQEGGGATYEMI